MRILLIGIILLFVQGISAQPKPYQESLISVVHTKTFMNAYPHPKFIVKIKNDLSIRFYNEYSKDISENEFERKEIWVVDSTLCSIDKADYLELLTAFSNLDFDSLYVPKEKSKDSIEMSKMGSSWNDYIVKTSVRNFVIGEGKERGETNSEALQKFVWSIEDIEKKYKPGN